MHVGHSFGWLTCGRRFKRGTVDCSIQKWCFIIMESLRGSLFHHVHFSSGESGTLDTGCFRFSLQETSKNNVRLISNLTAVMPSHHRTHVVPRKMAPTAIWNYQRVHPDQSKSSNAPLWTGRRRLSGAGAREAWRSKCDWNSGPQGTWGWNRTTAHTLSRIFSGCAVPSSFCAYASASHGIGYWYIMFHLPYITSKINKLTLCNHVIGQFICSLTCLR